MNRILSINQQLAKIQGKKEGFADVVKIAPEFSENANEERLRISREKNERYDEIRE
jgi:hypothetical protein